MRRIPCVLVVGLLACVSGCSPTGDNGALKPRKNAPSVESSRAPERAPIPDRSFAEFRPSVHGFAFPNAFTGSPLPVSLGGLEKHLGLPSNYGLCGGMSFAAADYFLADFQPPSFKDPPAKGHDLYDYLYSRQMDSLTRSLDAVPKFLLWMDLPDATPGGTRVRTLAGLGAILKSIDEGRPTVLGLVLTSTEARGALWENHQVLAYGRDEASSAGCRISIYDPNYPGNDEVSLVVRWKSAGPLVLGVVGSRIVAVPCPGVEVTRVASGRGRGRTRETPVRGFFLMSYSHRVPPVFAESATRGR